MTVSNLRIGKQEFVVVPKRDFERMRQLLAEDDADVREARRRVKDPKRKSIPLSRLKAQLGL